MKTKFKDFIEDHERRRLFEAEALPFRAAELISTLMEEQDLTKADLAKRIGRSRAFVTQVLSGSRNMTLHTFADLAFALGRRVHLDAVPLERDGISQSCQRVLFDSHTRWCRERLEGWEAESRPSPSVSPTDFAEFATMAAA